MKQLRTQGRGKRILSKVDGIIKESEVKAAQSCMTLCDSMDCSPWNSPGQNTGVGSLSFLQGIFPTQGSNSGLPHCRQILYQLSHKGSPRILEWVTFPFSRGSSRPRIKPGSPALQADSLPADLPGSASVGYIATVTTLSFPAHEQGMPFYS